MLVIVANIEQKKITTLAALCVVTLLNTALHIFATCELTVCSLIVS